MIFEVGVDEILSFGGARKPIDTSASDAASTFFLELCREHAALSATSLSETSPDIQ